MTRYHSLVVEATSLPDCFEVTAWSEHADGSLDEIMGLRHENAGAGGSAVPSGKHSERTGHQLLANFWPFPEKIAMSVSNRHEAKKNFPETLFTLLPVQIISPNTPEPLCNAVA